MWPNSQPQTLPDTDPVPQTPQKTTIAQYCLGECLSVVRLWGVLTYGGMGASWPGDLPDT